MAAFDQVMYGLEEESSSSSHCSAIISSLASHNIIIKEAHTQRLNKDEGVCPPHTVDSKVVFPPRQETRGAARGGDINTHLYVSFYLFLLCGYSSWYISLCQRQFTVVYYLQKVKVISQQETRTTVLLLEYDY